MTRPNNSQVNQLSSAYAQLGAPDVSMAAQKLQTAAQRTATASTLYTKATNLDRLVSTSGMTLKSVHYDNEIPEVEKLVSFRVTKQHLKEYKEFIQIAGRNSIDVATTIRDNGTAKNETLTAADYSVSTSSYNLTTTTKIVDTSAYMLTAKQAFTQTTFNHLVADVNQQATRYTWVRAERHLQHVADTSGFLVLNGTENFYANLRQTAGDAYYYSDHFKIQVGKNPPTNCQKGFGILNGLLGTIAGAVPGISQVANLLEPVVGSLEGAREVLGIFGSVANFAGALGSVGSIGGVLGALGNLGGIPFVKEALGSIGGLDAIAGAAQALGGGDILGAALNTATSIPELKGFLENIPGADVLKRVVDSSPDVPDAIKRISAVIGVNQLVAGSNETNSQLISANTRLTGGYGIYEVEAENEINMTACRVVMRAGRGSSGGSISVSANEAVAEGQALKFSALTTATLSGEVRASVTSKANTDVSSLALVTISAPIVQINPGFGLAAANVAKQIVSTASLVAQMALAGGSAQNNNATPPKKLPPALRAYRAVRSLQTQPAVSARYGGIYYPEPIGGTSGPSSGVKPGVQSDLTAQIGAATTPPVDNSRPVDPIDNPLFS